jgi:hypothetical protein
MIRILADTRPSSAPNLTVHSGFGKSSLQQSNENQLNIPGTPLAFSGQRDQKMKRLYTKITGETFEEDSESTPSLTGLLAAFLSGVLCCMLIHWVLF